MNPRAIFSEMEAIPGGSSAVWDSSLRSSPNREGYLFSAANEN
jgi:hypothetical protein